MNIDGWAFKQNEVELRDEYRERYEAIKHLKTKEHIEYSGHSEYAKNVFSGKLLSEEAKALSEFDIALLMDSGNLCFGGYCTRYPRRDVCEFSGAYYTD